MTAVNDDDPVGPHVSCEQRPHSQPVPTGAQAKGSRAGFSDYPGPYHDPSPAGSTWSVTVLGPLSRLAVPTLHSMHVLLRRSHPNGHPWGGREAPDKDPR